MSKSRRVAICLLVDHNDDILMGVRNDNKKWTTPSGHINVNEDPYEGAIRELKEETGLDAEDIKLVASHWDKDRNLILYLFKITPKAGQETDSSNDPDKEVDSWHYMNPNYVVSDLHVPVQHNIALKYWANN